MAPTPSPTDFSQDEAALLVTFAAQAMQVLATDHLEPSVVATEAFDIAEAMVKEYRRRLSRAGGQPKTWT
jgi:GAF domain-containing protein